VHEAECQATQKVAEEMELHFVLVSDERYARGLAVTLRSLLDSLTVDSTEGSKAETLHAARVLHVWLLDTGLSDETWARLRRMVQDHSTVTCSVNLHRIPAGAAVTLPAWDRSTSTSRIISTRGTACISLNTQASAPGARTAAATAAAAALCPGDNRSLEGVTYALPPCDSYANQSCWLKLLLPELLPPDVKYALYLDCDMLVKEDPCTLLDGAHKTFEVRTRIHVEP
jgi:lipopolysaccharide biosynthesis glycosyltransferase